ncbi:thermonuclease family protein [Brucella intermedia]|uniref:thermonuclease family protein n=1 Tax=Brucella intermedia TaxID=94625 RepID=UPI000468FA08|nr:thermonuclease family protein [Brucella intermedia]
MKNLILATLFAFAPMQALAADVINRAPALSASGPRGMRNPLPVFKGRVSVIDGRTLWLAANGQRVRLADIDACELPQWAFNPEWKDRRFTKAPPPVPCGPFAKAWLERMIGASVVTCAVVGYDAEGMARARCTSAGRDLALEMLRVGWARVDTPYINHPRYMAYQRAAMAARYGMWATYVLDGSEWRRKAVDKTLHRQPIADFNLLAERKSEISPPFTDLHRKPKRTDR